MATLTQQHEEAVAKAEAELKVAREEKERKLVDLQTVMMDANTKHLATIQEMESAHAAELENMQKSLRDEKFVQANRHNSEHKDALIKIEELQQQAAEQQAVAQARQPEHSEEDRVQEHGDDGEQGKAGEADGYELVLGQRAHYAISPPLWRPLQEAHGLPRHIKAEKESPFVFQSVGSPRAAVFESQKSTLVSRNGVTIFLKQA